MFTKCPVCGRIAVTRENLWKLRVIIIIIVPTSGVLGYMALPLIGFTAAGVRAGSTAAAWQASIGNVAAGSPFAALQSLGATGIGCILFGSTAAAMSYLIIIATEYLNWCNDPEHLKKLDLKKQDDCGDEDDGIKNKK